MPVIYFNVDKAMNALLKNSVVYTIRHERSTGQAVARKGSYYKFEVLGNVVVKRVLQLNRATAEAQLCEYVSRSGFDTVQEWLSNVKVWRNKMFLYKVEMM